MPGRFNPANAGRLLSEERRRAMDPDALVARFGIRPGDVLADVGCGPGFFTAPLGRACAPGAVWGVDIQPAMLELAHEHAAKEHVPNARFARVHEGQPLPLDDAGFDGVFCAFALHEMPDPAASLADMRRTLKPGGWLAIIEWHKAPSPYGPPLADRLDRAETERLLAAAGFTPRETWDVNEHTYCCLVSLPAAG